MWLRRNGLRLLFPVLAAWAVALLFGSWLFEWIPETRRGAIEAVVLVSVFALCAVTTWLVSRRWPGFLSVPPAASVGFLLRRTLVYAPVVFAGLAAFFGLAEFVNLRLTGDPTDPQYGVSVAFVVIWYPAALAPVLTLLAVWRAAKRSAVE